MRDLAGYHAALRSIAETMSAEVDADWAGRVHITYQRALAKHRKHSHWYWHAVRADAAG